MSTVSREHLEKKYNGLISEDYSYRHLVGYSGNRDIPFLRLFRYREAFSYRLVQDMIKMNRTEDDYVLDPFCGMGTTTYTSSDMGIQSTGIDRFILPVFVARTLPLIRMQESGTIGDTYRSLRDKIDDTTIMPYECDITYIERGYTAQQLERILKWRSLIDGMDGDIADIMRLILISSLEDASMTVKDGAYPRVVHTKPVVPIDEAMYRRVEMAEKDISGSTPLDILPDIRVFDAIQIENMRLLRRPNIVITSPPYLNRYDYTSIYAIETGLGLNRTNVDIGEMRRCMVRSHISGEAPSTLSSDYDAVSEILSNLHDRQDELNNRNIPGMIAGYFIDMESVIRGLCGIVRNDGRVVIVVGNTRFHGEVVPVDLIFCEMFERYGMNTDSIRMARYKGNSPQQMTRYGRVPVRESIITFSRP